MLRADKLATSYADCLEIWEPQPPASLRACPRVTLPLFEFSLSNFINLAIPFIFVLHHTILSKVRSDVIEIF
jgi:hypothetical protein